MNHRKPCVCGDKRTCMDTEADARWEASRQHCAVRLQTDHALPCKQGTRPCRNRMCHHFDACCNQQQQTFICANSTCKTKRTATCKALPKHMCKRQGTPVAAPAPACRQPLHTPSQATPLPLLPPEQLARLCRGPPPPFQERPASQAAHSARFISMAHSAAFARRCPCKSALQATQNLIA